MTQSSMKNPKIDWAPTLKKSCRESLTAVGIFSFIANLLMLVPAFFMLNVYDKAIGSNSVSTLLALSLIAVLMFGGLFAMEALRSRVLVAVSNKIDQIITPLVYEATLQNALRVGAHNASAQPISDFFSLRQFVSGNGAITVFDTPWLPIYLLVMFMFHPVLGWLGVVAALLMIIIAIANQKSTSTSLQEATALHQHHLRVAVRILKWPRRWGCLMSSSEVGGASRTPLWNCSRMQAISRVFFRRSQRHLGSVCSRRPSRRGLF